MPSRFGALAIAALLIGGCHGKKPAAKPGDGSSAGTGSANTSPNPRRVTYSFGTTQLADKAEVFLQSTDERGAQTSHSLGTFPGTCVVGDAPDGMGAILAITCKTGATGIQLQLVPTAIHDKILVMKMAWNDGVKPDPMARQQVDESAVPAGAAVDASK